MAVTVQITIVYGGARADELLVCLRSKLDGALSTPAGDSVVARVESPDPATARRTVRKALTGCGKDWRQYLAV